MTPGAPAAVPFPADPEGRRRPPDGVGHDGEGGGAVGAGDVAVGRRGRGEAVAAQGPAQGVHAAVHAG